MQILLLNMSWLRFRFITRFIPGGIEDNCYSNKKREMWEAGMCGKTRV